MRVAVYAFAFLGGCGVMVIEILGARVLNPHFGATLYIWTAQIGVTLACLAAGYWAGGCLARHEAEPPRAAGWYMHIGILSALAGSWMLCLPIIAGVMLPLLHGIDLRVGALAGSALLFAVPLCLLACLPPVCVASLSTGRVPAGTVAGRVYAVSTSGGFATTLCVGFWLIPAHSIRLTIQISGTVLLATGAAMAFFHAIRGVGRAVLVLAALCLGGMVTALWPRPLAGKGIVYQVDSPHAEIAVLDTGAFRTLLIDRVGHSVLSESDWMPIDPHFYYLNALTHMRPQGRQALLLGVAGGCALRAVESAGLCWDAVELDAEVLEAARTFLNLPDGPRIRYIVADGRTFLRSTDRRYDFIIMDTYASGGMPRHLCSKEAFGEARSVMSEAGILVVNLLGSRTGPNSRSWTATWHTLAAVFKHVRAFSSNSRSFSDALGVVTLFASDVSLDMPGPDLLPDGFSGTTLGHLRQMSACELAEPRGPRVLLTDDRNPIEGWALETANSVRAAWSAASGF